jgi:acetyl esterase
MAQGCSFRPPRLHRICRPGRIELLRDEGEAYGRKLAAARDSVRSVRYNRTIHDFMLLNPIANTPAVCGAVEQASDYLREAFAA